MHHATKLLLTGLFGSLILSVSLPAAAAEGDTLQRIEQRGSIVLGFREDRPPLSFRNPEGQVAGFSIDLCMAVAEAVRTKLGRTDLGVSFVPVTVEDRFQQIEEGKIDLLCGATTKTLGRQEQVDFSQLTFVTGATLLSRSENPVPGIGGLTGKTVAVIADTTTEEALNQRLEQAQSDAVVVTVESAQEGVDAVIAGEVSAFASDQVVLIGLVLTSTSGTRFAIANELFSFEPFALALPRNDADFRLVVNRTLAGLYRSGRVTPIYERWFSRFANEPPDLLQALYVLGSTPE
ncbi:MAG: amino acid ABC transporter substrate-binding protein [Rhodospirillales bacterium]